MIFQVLWELKWRSLSDFGFPSSIGKISTIASFFDFLLKNRILICKYKLLEIFTADFNIMCTVDIYLHRLLFDCSVGKQARYQYVRTKRYHMFQRQDSG